MKRILISACCLVLSSTSHAQMNVELLWSRTFDMGRGWCIDACRDGGFVLGCDHFRIIKTDSAGNPEWNRVYAVSQNADIADIMQHPDGGFVAVGSVAAATNDVYIVRTDSMGDTLWTVQMDLFNWDKGWSVELLDDGGYFVAGTSNRVENGDFFLSRLDSAGNILWTEVYLSPEQLQNGDLSSTADGGAIIAGTSAWNQNDSLDGKYYLRVDSQGDLLWTRLLPGRLQSFCWRSKIASNNEYLLVGCNGYNGFWTGDQNAHLCKINDEGDTLWTREYNFQDAVSSAYDVITLGDTGYVMTGTAHGGTCLIRTNSEGDSVWAYVGLANVIGYGVCLCDDGGYAVVGGRLVSQTRYVELARFSPEHPVAISEPRVRHDVTAALLSHFPSPFNSSTQIVYETATRQRATLSVTNILGRHVAMLYDGVLEPGEHRFTFDASALPSGIYFARVEAGEFVQTQKLLLLK